MKNIFSIIIGATLFLGANTASAATLYFPFDEGTGTTSSASVGTGKAQIVGGAGWTSGKSGTGIGLDGKMGQTVLLGENILPQAIEGSLSMWVKWNTPSDYNYFLSARSTTDDKVFWALAVDREGRLLVRYRTGGGAIAQKNESSAILDKDTWYNVVVTANSQKYTFFVNGEEVGSSNVNIGKWIPDILSGTIRYDLGSLDAYEHKGVLDGFIDDVRFFASPLTLQEVKMLYAEVNEKSPSVPLGALPVIQLSTSDKTIPFGGSVSVSWTVTNADTCTATWAAGPVAFTGTQVFTNLAVSQSYNMTCIKTGGSQATVGENVQVLSKGEVATSTVVTSPASTTPVTEIVLGAGPKITRTLMVGSRGADVTLLQEYLNKKGLLGVKATGYFGMLTEAAVKAFQKQHGFEQVGFVGPKTRAKLLVAP